MGLGLAGEVSVRGELRVRTGGYLKCCMRKRQRLNDLAERETEAREVDAAALG